MIETVTCEALREALDNNESPVILDVRTHVECELLRLDCEYHHRPLHNFNAGEEAEAIKNVGAERPVFMLCKAGGRAMKAAQELAEHGIENIKVVDGGIDACHINGVYCLYNPEGPDEETCQQAIRESAQRYEQKRQAR